MWRIFTGSPGKYASLKETIRGFKAIWKVSMINPAGTGFYMAGGIEEVIEKAAK